MAEKPPNIPRSRTWNTLLIATIAFALFRYLASFIAEPRLWGINYLRYLGFPWDLLLTIPLIALCLPYLRRQLGVLHDSLNKPVTIWIIRGYLVIFLFLTLFFPIRTFFYGDGGLLIPQIYTMAAGGDYDPDLLLNLKSSPLAGVFILGLSKSIPYALDMLTLPLPKTAHYPFTWLSLLSLSALIIFFVRKKNLYDIALLLTATTGTAGCVFFFGYIEYYVPVFVGIFFYLIFAERFLAGKGHFWPVVAAFIVALFSHYFTLALLPSLAYLFLHKRKQYQVFTSTKYVCLATSLIISACIIIYFVGGFAQSESRIVMPLFPVVTPAGTLSYTLLSSYHLFDLLNILFLLAPVPFLFLLFHTRSNALTTELSRFHFLTIVFFFLYLFFANTSLGLARDWDISAPLGLMLAFFALQQINQSEEPEKNAQRLYIGLSSVIAIIPWLVINISSTSSAIRFANILDLDSRNMYKDYALSGYEALRKHHQNQGDTTKDIALCAKKIEILDYPADYLSIIGKSLPFASTDAQKYDELHLWMLDRLRDKARYLRASNLIKDYSISITQIDSLAEVISFVTYLNKHYHKFENSLGDIAQITGTDFPYPVINALEAYRLQDYPRAIDGLQVVIKKNFLDPRIFLVLGTALGIEKRYMESLSAFELGIKHFPDDVLLLSTLSKYYIQSQYKLENARIHLQHCLELPLSPRKEQEVRDLLSTLDSISYR